MTNKVVFLSAHRSRSTILQEMCKGYQMHQGLLPLDADDTHLFNAHTTKGYGQIQESRVPLETYPVSRAAGMSVHYITDLYHSFYDSIVHKLAVLEAEKRAGREYIIKVMSDTITEDVIDFFSDRKFVVTTRNDIFGLYMSQALALTTNWWQKRLDVSLEHSVAIPENIAETALFTAMAASSMHNVVDMLQQKGLQFELFDYDDLQTVQQREAALDKVFGSREWFRGYTDNLPQDMEVDYRQVISNYDQVVEFWNVNIEKIKQYVDADHIKGMSKWVSVCFRCPNMRTNGTCKETDINVIKHLLAEDARCPLDYWRKGKLHG